MFNILKDGFQAYIDGQALWMADEATKLIAKKKIEAMTAEIGYATIASNDALLDDYYERVSVDSHVTCEHRRQDTCLVRCGRSISFRERLWLPSISRMDSFEFSDESQSTGSLGFL
jgi:hypothetical protein